MRGAGIIGNHKYNAGYFLIYRHLNLLRCAFNIMGYAVGLAVNRSCRVRNIDIKLCGLVFKSCVNYYIVDIVKSVQLKEYLHYSDIPSQAHPTLQNNL